MKSTEILFDLSSCAFLTSTPVTSYPISERLVQTPVLFQSVSSVMIDMVQEGVSLRPGVKMIFSLSSATVWFTLLLAGPFAALRYAQYPHRCPLRLRVTLKSLRGIAALIKCFPLYQASQRTPFISYTLGVVFPLPPVA